MADADLVSVLDPFDYVCKQADAAKSEGKLRKIYIKVGKKDGKKLLKKLVERTRQEGDKGEELRQLVQRYIARLREEVPNKFDRASRPLQEFQEKVVKDLSRPDPARFSLATTKGPRDDCFVALVNKDLEDSEESGDVVGMTFYFLEDGVKRRDTGGAVQGEEEEGAVGGAVGGAPEEERHRATLVLTHDNRKSFERSLKNNIHLCHGHIRPALEALRTGCNSYTDGNGKTCKFNSSGGDRQLVQGHKKFKSKLGHKLYGMNPQSGSRTCKVHLNGDGSDCLLVYVDQNYRKIGRVFLLVGVLTHSECGIKTGARKKEHGTQTGNTLDITEDMEAAEEFLEKQQKTT